MDALTAASTGLAAIGAPTGPLHAADRAWVAQQSSFPGPPSLYVCALQYIAWREVRKLASADVAADCLKRALAARRTTRSPWRKTRACGHGSPGMMLPAG